MALNSDRVDEPALPEDENKVVGSEVSTTLKKCIECFDDNEIERDVENVETLVEYADDDDAPSTSSNVDEISENPVDCKLGEEHKCICGFPVNLVETHNCISELRHVIESQASCIVELQNSLKKVRKYVRTMEKRILEREAEYRAKINEKLDILSENLDEIMKRDTRRCNGRCRKHVQTEKCLCRGFTTAAPHVCCGKQGGICDC